MRTGLQEHNPVLRVVLAGETDIGLMRRSNQDSFGLLPELGLAVVCDGLGGLPGGDVASRIACDAFLAVAQQELETSRRSVSDSAERALSRAAAAANRAVRAHAGEEVRLRGMGTTLVGMHIAAAELTLINIGDSRAYLFRDGEVRQLTRDHSYIAEQVRLGRMTEDAAARSSLQSVITRAVGIAEDVQSDLFRETLAPGDGVLLCSDGLIRHVSDDELSIAFRNANDQQDPAGLCHALIQAAKAGGGSDNITCVVALLEAAAA